MKSMKKRQTKVFHNYYIIIIGKAIERQISDTSTIYSNNTKDIEDVNNNNSLIPIKSLDILLYSYLDNSIFKRISLFYLKYNFKVSEKNFIIFNNKNKFDYKCINYNNNLNIKEIKDINPINKKISQNYKDNIINKININDNTSEPVCNTQNIDKEYISKKNLKTNLKKIKNDLFTQDKDIVKYMKTEPCSLPNLYSHDYNLKNNSIIEKSNETLGKVNRDTIPITFYNHLMIFGNKKIVNKKNKISITQRNKRKLLTIIYYSP